MGGGGGGGGGGGWGVGEAYSTNLKFLQYILCLRCHLMASAIEQIHFT